MPKKFGDVRNQPTIDSFFQSQKSEIGSQSQKKMSQKRQSQHFLQDVKKIKLEKINPEGLEDDSDVEIILYSSTSASTLTQEFDSKLQNGFKSSPKKAAVTNADSTTNIHYEEFKMSQLSTPTKSAPSTSTLNGSFTPKRKVPGMKLSPKKSSRKLLQKSVDEEKLYQAIENINSVKERSTEGYEFELEKIYSANSFEYKYAELDTTQTMRYEIGDVVVPRETYADHLFSIIAEVLSNKINCEYFSKEELDIIYSYLCLNAGAQIVFTKMIRRKRGLHRVKTMVQFEDNLKPFIQDLIQHKFLSSDLSNFETELLLNLLQTKETKQLSQMMMRTVKMTKKESIENLMKLARNHKSHFGAMSPAVKLRHNVVQLVETCVFIPDNILSIFDRFFTLFLPCEYPINQTIQEIFLMMLDLEQEKYQFYSLPTERYPVFRNRDHLVSFVESQLTYAQAIQASEQKQWDVVISLGKLAFEKFKYIVENTLVESSQMSVIPRHVGRFYTGHTWGKIVWHSVAALKKSKETMPLAEMYLKYLLKQYDYVQTYKGKWYDELALIKSYHQSDNEAAVKVLVDALRSQELAELDQINLIEKLKSYSKKKKSLNNELKEEVELFLKDLEGRIPSETLASITITGKKLNRSESNQGKSKWEVTNSKENKLISSVEYVAANYYKERGFQDCLHCEGALPVSLFALFFWEQMFRVSVPGTFLSSYQEAPLDLYSSKFYENRKYQIDEKIKYLEAKDHVEFVEYMTEQYIKYKNYKTVFADIYESDEQFRGMVYSLGFNAIFTMCKKLLENFRVWKSGFPDLIVWNAKNKSYKIVEVKGPKDTLSTKQRLWMQHLQQNAICTELCFVKAE